MRTPCQARFAHHGLALRCLSAAILVNLALPARATTTLNAGTTTQTLSTDTSYVVNSGSLLSATSGNTLVVNGIAPVTITNDGRLFNANGFYAALLFNVSGTIVNQADGAIEGSTYGIQAAAGTMNITNRGDISAISSHPIAYTANSNGTIDNYGTINNGTIQAIGNAPNGVVVNTTGTVTINNHLGASIKSGVGNASFGIGISAPAGTTQLTNDGLIAGYQQGVKGAGSSIVNIVNSSTGVIQGTLKPAVELLNASSIVNRGMISGANGVAVQFDGNSNQLTLDAGSSLSGNIVSLGTGNLLTLQGSGNLPNTVTGFANITMAGSSWSLSGNVSTNGTTASATNVQSGTLIVSGTLTNGGTGGGTTIAPGASLQIGNGVSDGSITGSISNHGALIFNTIGNTINNSVISGTSDLQKIGPGSLQLTATNTYTGSTIVSGGTLAVTAAANLGALNNTFVFSGGKLLFASGSSQVDGRPIIVQAAGGTVDTNGFNITYSGVASGPGNLTKIGNGNLTLTGNNLHSGNFIVNAGVLTLGNGGSTGSVAANMVLNSTDGLVFNRSNALTYGGVISGIGGVTMSGGGTLSLTGANTYSGPTSIIGGSTLSVGADENLGAPTSGLSIGNGTLQLAGSFATARDVQLVGDTSSVSAIDTQGNTNTFSGAISGVSPLTKNGSGTLILTNNSNSYSGVTTINEGTLQIGSGATSGYLPGDVTGSGVLAFDRSDAVTYSGRMSGSGSLLQLGSGTLTLIGAHSYTGTTTIASGILQLGNGGSTGSIDGNVIDQGTLVFNRNDNVTFSHAISGNGALVQQGAGALTLSGAQTYTGLTAVNAGRLNIDGSVAGNVTVAANAILGGSGAIAGNVTVADGGHLSPGDSPGTLQVGGLLLNAGSLLDYELGVPDIIGSGINDLVNVTGNLTLDGTLNITDAGGFGANQVTAPGAFATGVYRLFNYGGSLTDNGLNLGALPTDFSPNELLLQTSVGGQVNLIVQSGGFGNQYWDGPHTAGNGVVDGGTSTWDLLATHWTGADGAANAPWQSGFAVFQGAAGTVTLGQNVSFSGMQFSTDGYRIAGNGFSLAGAQDTIVNVDPFVKATIDAPLVNGSGTTALTKSGTGTLILTANNSYSGGTVIDSGTLQIGNGGTSGSVLGSVVNNGTLAYFRANTGSAPYQLSNTISGAGTIRLMGTGVSDQSSYVGSATGTQFSGAVIVESGARLALNGANSAGQAGLIVQSGGGLWLNANASYDTAISLAGTGWNEPAGFLGALRMSTATSVSGPVLLAANARIGTYAASDTGTISGAIDDRGLGYALEKAGAGTLTLTGTNTFTGGTNISGGTLQIGNGGTTGSIVGDISNSAALVFNRSDTPLYGGVISGTGTMTKLAAGVLTLTGDSSYTGGTTISAGTLQLGNGGTSGSVAGNILDNGALVFHRFDDLSYAGAVSGSGSLAQIGAGTLTLTGTNSYTGGTTISAGTLQIGAGGTVGSIVGDITDNSALVFNRSDDLTYAGVISGSGSLSQSGSNVLTLTGNSSYAGGTSIHAGTLQIGGGGTSGSIVGDVLDDAELRFNRSDAITYGGVIRGNGVLVQAGSGTLTLTGDNLYSGGTLIDAGTLQLGAGGVSGSLLGDVANNGGLIFNRSDAVTFDGVISGTGSVTQSGAGTTILTGANLYTGGTTIAAGTLQLGNGGSSGSIVGDMTDNGALIFNRSDNLTYAGVVSGTGSMTQSGPGNLILTGANVYTGGTIIGQGALQIGAGGASGSIVGNVVNNGGLIFNRSDGIAFGGVVSGSGYLTQAGTGTLTLAGTNTYEGGTFFNAGVLQAASDTQLGAAPGALAFNGGTLQLAASFDTARHVVINGAGGSIDTQGNTSAFSGSISGAGVLTKLGSGTLIITGTDTSTGNTTISAGVLQIGNGGNDGSLAGNVNNNGSLIFNRSDNLTYAGVVSGTGTLAQSGTGTLSLSGAHSYTGLTTLNSGRLNIDGSIAGDATVLTNATLGGVGTVGGNVTVANGGHLSPGDSPGTLHLGSLVLNNSSQLDYELGQPNIVGGLANDLTEVTGNLTLAGVLNVTDVGGFGTGVYRLFDYGGALANNGLAFGVLPTSFTASDLLIQTAVAGQVNLIVQSGGFALQFWDGANTVGNGVVDGGTGPWNTGATQWTNAAGSTNAPWQGGFAVFQGSAGTVTLAENIAFSGMQFTTDGYNVVGNGFSLAGSPDTVIRVDPAVTATITAPIVDGGGGAVTLSKTGLGTLTLAGTNAYSGGTAIDAGVLQISSDANLGATTGALSLDDGTLASSASLASARVITLGTNGGSFAPAIGTTLTLGGVAGGVGQLAMTGTGTLVLSGNNTYGGGTRLDSGVLQVANDANLGASSGNLDFEGGTLRLGASFDPASTRNITLGTSGSIDTNGFSSTFAQVIDGPGALTKLGAGSLVLTADNTYAGGTTITAGTLQIGSGGTTGSLIGDVVNAGSLVFNRSNNLTYAGSVSGTGTLAQQGSGVLTVLGDISESGNAVISAGTLQIGNGGTLGTLSGAIVNDGTLVFNRSDVYAQTASISGSGSVEQRGSGTLVLEQANSYTGGTQISSGTLQVGSGGVSGSIVGDVVNQSLLVFNRADDITFAGAISGGGSVTQSGPGRLTLTGDSTYTDGTTIAAGLLQLGAGGTTGSIVGPVANDGSLVFDRSDNVTFADVISGAGSLTQAGTGTLVLTGTNLYAGGTTISAGTLQLGNGTNNGSVIGDIADDGILIFNRPDAINVSGAISGSGAVVQQGTGVTTLSGANNYSGGTTINDGVLSADGDARLGDPAGNVTFNGGTLRFSAAANSARAVTLDAGGGTIDTQGFTDAFSGVISGAGAFTKQGSGTLVLTGDNTYTGATTILSGTLQVGANGTTGAIVGNVVDYGTLVFARSDNPTYGGSVSGTGALIQAGAGTLILTGDSNYTGLTTIQAGAIQLGNGGTTGSIMGNVLDDGALLFNRSDTLSYGGFVSGPGTLTQAGTGTLILTGDHSYTGLTTIAAGTLALGNGGNTGSVAGDIVNNAALVFNHSDRVTYANVISGSGTLTQQGSSPLTLTGANSYTGLTTVASSGLTVDGSIAGDVQVAADATLGGVGSVGGNVTLAANGHLAPGDSPGTLSVGSLILNSASQLDYQLGQPNVVGHGVNDLTEVAGNLTLAGVLNITDVGGFGTGVYRIFNYGGALSGTTLGFGALPTGTTTSDLVVQTSLPGQVNLLVSSGGYALQFWDGSTTTSTGSVVGGTGTWNGNTTNWTNAGGTLNAPWQAGFAIFQATGGTVTLAENVSVSGMQFDADGYILQGGAFQLQAAKANTLIRVSSGDLATINAPIVDGASVAAALIKSDAGTLVLGASNSYSGGTSIIGGSLQVASDSNLGAASGALTLDGGTLASTATFASARNVTIHTKGGAFAPATGTTLTLSGAVTGAGELNANGAGTLDLTGANSYSGGTLLSAGVLRASSDANLGAASGALDFEGGSLQLGASFDPAATRAVTFGAAGGRIDTNGFTATFAQAIGGAGGLTTFGSGTLILTGDNTYGGGSTIAGGSLQLGNGGTSGSVVGDIVDNGNLAFNHSGNVAYAGLITGSGTLTQSGSGVLTLSGDNTYSGTTTIASGTLQLGTGGEHGSVAGDVVDHGALIFNRSDNLTYARAISGSGNLTKLGTNTLTLTGNNTYGGITTISGGVLQLGDGGASGAIAGSIVNNGGLQFNRSDNVTYAGDISGSGWVRQAGAGTTTLSGNNSYTNGSFIDAGVLSVSADGNLGAVSGIADLNGGTLQWTSSFDTARNFLIDAAGGTLAVTERNALTGQINGTGVLTKTGGGALIFNTVANYTGLTRVVAGTLAVGDSTHSDAKLAGGGGVDVGAGAFLGGYGEVVGHVANAGTVAVGNALPVFASEPDASFSISGPLINSGVVTMVNGLAEDRLNVGTYVSNGGQLQIDTVLNEGGESAHTDRLTANAITVAAGPTAITTHNVGGTGAVTQGDGIPLVSIANPQASAAGAFILLGRAVAGPYEYLLFQGGVTDPADGQWYLRSAAQPTPAPPVPIFRPEVGAYLANRQLATEVMMQTLHNRQGDPQYSSDGSTDADSTMGKLWFRAQGGITRTQAADGLIDSKGEQSLFQLGGDVGSWNLFNADDRLHVGGMAGYANGSADITAQFNPTRASGRAYGYFAGAYATWFANNDQRLGSYVDTWLQYGWFTNRVRSAWLPDVHYDSTDWAASIEYGYGIAVGKNWVVEPQAQVIYNNYRAGSLTDSTGTRVSSLGGSDTMERLGVRFYPQLSAGYNVRPFVEVNWWHGGGSHSIAFNGITVADQVPNNRYQVNVGLQGRIGRGWVIWGRFGNQWGSNKFERVDGQIGVKYSW